MGRMDKEEQRFSKDIDQLLNGEEVTLDESLSEEYKSVYELSNRLLESQVDPSEDFRLALKNRLLQKLQMQEIEESREAENNWFRDFVKNLIHQTPALRAATVTVFVLVIAFIAVWRIGLLSPATDTPIVGQPPDSDEIADSLIKIRADETGDIKVSQGVEITLDLIFENVSGEPVTINPFPPMMFIAQESSLRPVIFFEEGTQIAEILPESEISYTLIWDQKESDGSLVAPGWYTVHIGELFIITESQPDGITTTFTSPARIRIQAP
jgi:hypothetical protein